VTNVDATGWRPTPGELDRYGREIPDGDYGTKDFERILAFKRRTEAVAKHLTEYLKKTDRFAKTIIFCVDQDHAEEMRMALNNLNTDLVRDHPNYVCRITAEEGKVGRGHLSDFMELEKTTPTLVTTSKLLSTGVDVQTCKNIVIFRVVGSMTEFKQIIGRGTRIRDDYGKLYFTILDYIGSATTHFADPDFDGQPAIITEEEMDEDGNTVEDTEEVVQPEEELAEEELPQGEPPTLDLNDAEKQPRKFFYDGGAVVIAASLVYELGADGVQLRIVKLTEYTAEKVRDMYSSAAALRSKWSNAEERAAIIKALEDRGITFEQLAEATKKPDADPFDLLCNIAFNVPLRTRRERAEMVRKNRLDFFDQYSPEARDILCEILDKYIEHGVAQLADLNILKIPPLSNHGTVIEIAAKFGGPDQMRSALIEMQNLLYAA